MTDRPGLARAKSEFAERLERESDRNPWCDYPPPLDFPWPDYVETRQGRQWWIPATATDRALERH
jgi:aminobenzoyl-glutamate utilization protein B